MAQARATSVLIPKGISLIRKKMVYKDQERPKVQESCKKKEAKEQRRREEGSEKKI